MESNERFFDHFIREGLDRFIREAEVRRITGLSRSTRWRLERDRKFPKRRRISPNAVGWLASEIREWMEGSANA